MSDNEFFMERAFPVGNLSQEDIKSLNPDQPPEDAIQYLKLVAYEAKQLDDVVVAKIDESKLKKQTVVYKLQDKPTSSLAPSREWKICQVSDFSNLRINIAKLQLELDKKNSIAESLPDRGDEVSWCIYCYGSKFAKEIPYEMRGRSYKVQEGEEIPGSQPLLSVLCAMNQATVEQVLEFQTQWFEHRPGFTANQGRWLYALLARLELPLIPDVCSMLRTLARCSAHKRDEMTSKGETVDSALVTSLNLIICLVSVYFRQLDLEDV